MPTFNRNEIAPKPSNGEHNYKNFSAGVHEVKIRRAELTNAKTTGRDMISFILESQFGETGFYNLVFGTEKSDGYLQRILASVADNGFEVPNNFDFGYNEGTVQFLASKDVFIEVVEEEFNDAPFFRINAFLTSEEYYHAVDSAD
ncbi:MAG: hypothetical protein LBI43_06730 [Streptococcaceae bacterium]|jgi:hypothetical protein|nr:hypothetical protein [Streptococcaceae bacterium]